MDRLRFLGGHVARLATIWLAGIVVYALVFVRPLEPVWLAIDLAILAAFAPLVRRTPRDVWWCAAIALACTLISQLVIPDRNGVWADESAYLATLREGRILVDGVSPFNLRWLEPFLAGPLNIFPASDANALKAVNFGALVVTGAYLAWLMLRVGVARRIALAAPAFLLASYLGVYASTNRLVLDPFNYAVYAVVAHALVRRDHARYLSWILLAGAFNSEKIVYWIPVVLAAELLGGARLVSALKTTLRCALPAGLYLAVMVAITRGAAAEQQPTFVEQLYRMAFSPLPITIHDDVAAATTMQMLWFPFGAFTIFALLALPHADRRLRALAMLIVPVLAQTVIATDTQRMTAYAFIVYLPLGAVYLSRALAALPRRAAALLYGALVATVVAERFLLPACRVLREHGVPVVKVVLHAAPVLQPALAAAEIALVLVLVYWHLAVATRG